LLRKKIRKENPTILILQESKCSEEALKERMKNIWRNSKIVAIDALGTAGVLAIIWDPSRVSLHNFMKTPWSITAEFHSIDTDIIGVITGVYGLSTPMDKGNFLDSLLNIADMARGKH